MSAPTLPSVTHVLESALPGARWFAAQGRTTRIRALTPLPWLRDDYEVPAVRLEIAEVVDADDPEWVEHYLVALCYRTPADPAGPGMGVALHSTLGPVAVHEATADPYAGDVLLEFVSTAQDRSDGTNHLRHHILDTSTLRPGLPAHRFGGEQSNTSILYADVALLKLFRRLVFDGEQGGNPDIEIHRALATGPARRRLAGLYGWLNATWVDSTGAARTADLGMLLEQIPAAVDGWQLAVDSLLTDTDFTTHATAIGEALREVHEGLAAAFGTSHNPAADRSTAMRERLLEAVAEVGELTVLHGPLDSRLARLGTVATTSQRIHGDFHLGQVLCPKGSTDWRIIDFEGEPLTSLTQRRNHDSVWRDVAGLLRSLDYAGAYAEQEHGVDHDRARDWVALTRSAFLQGYAERVLAPDETDLVRAYEIDKAVYECRYEARHRPDLLAIPLGALAGLIDLPAAPTATTET